MHEDFIDDRLNSDMIEVRKIMKHTGTNPVFNVEFRRNESNNIVVQLTSLYTTMPPIVKPITDINKIGEVIVEYIKDTANWI